MRASMEEVYLMLGIYITAHELSFPGACLGESFADIRARVESARARQRVRFADTVNGVGNSDMRAAEVRQLHKLYETSESLGRAARLSACSFVALWMGEAFAVTFPVQGKNLTPGFPVRRVCR